ncbi:hypothetical protein CO251_04125 [Sulfobacillus sp. hq2]|nr:hypothetical protein CO251_04125 [Sulfobacillus sp. hq2]
MGAGMLVGFQGGAGFFERGRLSHTLSTLWLWGLGMVVVVVLWQTTGDRAPASLRGWWFAAGCILVFKALADIQRHQRISHTLSHLWVEPLEAVGTLWALVIGSGQVLAVVTGFVAGFALPFALQNWMSPWHSALTVLRTITLGAVGLENIVEALAPMRVHMDLEVLWMVPWLIWWEVSDWFWRDSSTTWQSKR